jgi:hypothetical protein
MLPQRTVTAGDTIELLVLAMSGGELLGVDCASGSFVRVADPGGPPLRPYDIVRLSVLGGEPSVWSPHAPELVETTSSAAAAVGSVPVRRAERWVRALVDPPGAELLGFRGPAVPFWTLRGERPSMAIVRPATMSIRPSTSGGAGYRCLFEWRNQPYDLPLWDDRLLALLDERGAWRASGGALAHLLGYRPERVLVALSAPMTGHCYKVAAGLLPAR